MEYVRIADTDINHKLLHQQMEQFISDQSLENLSQISLTSIAGDDDWECTVGKLHLLDHPERFYSVINESLSGTYIHELISRYSKYYRWRLLRLTGRSCYSVHSDRNAGDKFNIRLHIPVITNPDAFLCFYPEKPSAGKDLNIRHEHLIAGNSYEVNTTGLHSAINYGIEDRYHIVGVRYENSNNW